MRIHRVLDDSGELARISLTLTDADDEPITSGTVTLRVAGLFEKTMQHDAEGVWFYDPEAGDLDTRGAFYLEVKVDGVTLPAEQPYVLEVREPVTV